jgi:hypothetical protein
MSFRQAFHRSSSQWAAIYRLSPWKFWLTVVFLILAFMIGSFLVPVTRQPMRITRSLLRRLIGPAAT